MGFHKTMINNKTQPFAIKRCKYRPKFIYTQANNNYWNVAIIYLENVLHKGPEGIMFMSKYF